METITSVQNKKQVIPPELVEYQARWQDYLITTCKGQTIELLTKIPRYIAENYKNLNITHSTKYYDPEVLKSNMLRINKDWIDIYNMYSKKSYRRSKIEQFNKSLKVLIREGVLYKEDKDLYMLNPLYYCSNKGRFVEMYIKWCRLTEKKPQQIHLNNSLCVWSSNGRPKFFDEYAHIVQFYIDHPDSEYRPN